MFSKAERAALPAYGQLHGCDARLNAWCDANCPHHATHGALLARYAHSKAGPYNGWRCYSRSSLGADAQTYLPGTDTYCTRHDQLWKQLGECRAQPQADAPEHERQKEMERLGRLGAAEQTKPTPVMPSPSPAPLPRPPAPVRTEEAWIDGPQSVPPGVSYVPPYEVGGVPRYEHDAALMVLSPRIAIPRREDCAYALPRPAAFLGISMYTDAYAYKAEYLRASCVAVGVCCALSHVPNDAFGEDAAAAAQQQSAANDGKLPNFFRHRLIASKPLFILSALRASALPVAWMDVDLEFHQFPELFQPAAPATWGTPRDVLLWNWQANVSMFKGKRLKMASGVAFFNKTKPAEALLTAWSEAMAFAPNSAAPDDQAMDELVNGDGWIARVAWGWLPAKYLRMLQRHRDIMPTPADCVLNHDRDQFPGRGNSNTKPVLPPRARAFPDEL